MPAAGAFRTAREAAGMRWLRYEHDGAQALGALDGETITRHDGDLFGTPVATGETVALEAVTLLPPVQPPKLIGLWNNFGALGAKLGLGVPAHPLYFIKASSYATTGAPIRKPQSYAGRVIFEAELGVVIGKRCANASEDEARDAIFGYTCVNDVTAVDWLNEDASFAQWTRAKSCDGFGIFGPVIVTDVDPETLTIRAVLDGQERQNYPVSDMLMKPARLVSLISHDMTLLPGDLIACGTSVGAGSMKPGMRIEIHIDGIGTLTNPYEG